MITSVASQVAGAADPETGTAAELGFVLGILTLATVFVLVLIRQGISLYRARTGAARDGELREALRQSTQAHERHAAAVERAEGQLADLSRRFTELERVLKDVE
jgi:hypothetical protein